eukprot:scaffold1440_cov114-Isochrysis_galbana.AAC.9
MSTKVTSCSAIESAATSLRAFGLSIGLSTRKLKQKNSATIRRTKAMRSGISKRPPVSISKRKCSISRHQYQRSRNSAHSTLDALESPLGVRRETAPRMQTNSVARPMREPSGQTKSTAMAAARSRAASRESHSSSGDDQRKERYSTGFELLTTCRQWSAPKAAADTRRPERVEQAAHGGGRCGSGIAPQPSADASNTDARDEHERKAGGQQHVDQVAAGARVRHEGLTPDVETEPAEHVEQHPQCGRHVNRIGRGRAGHLGEPDDDPGLYEEVGGFRRKL